MALSSHDCGRMIKASEKNNKRLFAIKQNRFNPPVSAVKKLIDNGSLGKIYSIQLTCFGTEMKIITKTLGRVLLKWMEGRLLSLIILLI